MRFTHEHPHFYGPTPCHVTTTSPAACCLQSVTTGKERTWAEWEQVAAAAGLTITSIKSLMGSDLCAIVLHPA
jgi:hypothetical protein